MDTASGQFVQSSSDFPYRAAQSVYRYDDELVAFTEPADAFGPPRSITTSTPGSGIGEHAVRDNPCSRNSILLLIDGLLSSRDPEIGGDTHRVCNKKSPIFIPVSDSGVLGISCGTGKSDYPTCSDVMRGWGPLSVPDL